MALVALLTLGATSAWAQIKVACIGASITAGHALFNPGAESRCPSQLAAQPGSGYTVGNFGLSAAAVLKRSDYPAGSRSIPASS